MAKLNEMSYDIRESIKAFSDDTETDDRYLHYLINTKRAKYLRQDLNNFQKTTDLSIQQTFCLGLEEVSANECGVDLDCDKITRTKKPLPKAIELHTKSAITKVKPTNKVSRPFNFITREKAVHVQDAVFGKSIYAFLDVDNYIYFLSDSSDYKLIDCISISGVFENPQDLINYTNCCNCEEDLITSCYSEDTEYPLQPHYVDLIKSEIVNDLLKLKNVPEDKINDAND